MTLEEAWLNIRLLSEADEDSPAIDFIDLIELARAVRVMFEEVVGLPEELKR